MCECIRGARRRSWPRRNRGILLVAARGKTGRPPLMLRRRRRRRRQQLAFIIIIRVMRMWRRRGGRRNNQAVVVIVVVKRVYVRRHSGCGMRWWRLAQWPTRTLTGVASAGFCAFLTAPIGSRSRPCTRHPHRLTATATAAPTIG